MDEHTPDSGSGQNRAAEPGDEIARTMFSPDELGLSPDEYVARHAQEWGCFSFHEFRYADDALGAWVRRVGELLFADGEVERCRLQFLTPGELAAIRAREAEAF